MFGLMNVRRADSIVYILRSEVLKLCVAKEAFILQFFRGPLNMVFLHRTGVLLVPYVTSHVRLTSPKLVSDSSLLIRYLVVAMLACYKSF